jgi:hypothetical protein
MQRQKKSSKLSTKDLVKSRTLFLWTLLIVPALVLVVYITGVKDHRPFYVNAIISGSILSALFLVFITFGLYKGWQLKDDFDSISVRINKWRKPKSSEADVTDVPVDVLDEGGIGGVLISILMWILIGMFGAIVIWLIGAIVWIPVVIATGMLYWVVYNCYSMIFQKSAQCKGNLMESLRIAILYTGYYTIWASLILFGIDYLRG